MDIAEALKYIHSVKWRGSKPGLSRTRELLSSLGNPERSLKFVHIAGTNGKGSTAACISSILQNAGYKTGLYISPYVSRFNERMQIDGEHISDDELIALVEEVRPHAEAMADLPTEFELITALAMKYFLNNGCGIVVLEVGMGGELDSTNVIGVPEATVITSVGYDHVKELGPSIADIARAKAGIIKDGADVAVYGGADEVMAVFASVCAERGASLRCADFSRISRQKFSPDGIKFDFSPYGRINLPLAGTYQTKNAALSITAVELLREKGYPIVDDDIVKGLGHVRWPGRFEFLGRDPAFILDGAHNPQAVEATVNSLSGHFGDRRIVFLFGVMADKDVDSMIGHIAPTAEIVIAVRPDNPRAMASEALADKLRGFGVPAKDCATVAAGVAEAVRQAGKGGVVCAMGSLYFSQQVRGAYANYDALRDHIIPASDNALRSAARK